MRMRWVTKGRFSPGVAQSECSVGMNRCCCLHPVGAVRVCARLLWPLQREQMCVNVPEEPE